MHLQQSVSHAPRVPCSSCAAGAAGRCRLPSSLFLPLLLPARLPPTANVCHRYAPVHAAQEGEDGGAVADLQQAGVGDEGGVNEPEGQVRGGIGVEREEGDGACAGDGGGAACAGGRRRMWDLLWQALHQSRTEASSCNRAASMSARQAAVGRTLPPAFAHLQTRAHARCLAPSAVLPAAPPSAWVARAS